MVYETNILVCHNTAANMFGSVWVSILAAEAPNRKHRRQQEGLSSSKVLEMLDPQ